MLLFGRIQPVRQCVPDLNGEFIMQTNSFKEARVSLYIIAVLLSVSLAFYFFASMFTSMGLSALRRAKSADSDAVSEYPVIILDAGHGGEDPGACANGLEEKKLNLEIAQSLKELLSQFGYSVVLTRNEDVLLYNAGEEGHKKFSDVRNREAVAESFPNAVFVSIHFNKFPMESCKGLQTFYSDNNSNSIRLAESIQSNAYIIQPDNKRTVKCGNDSIYLMKNLEMPAVLIECGFLSNPEEAALLSKDDYKKALVLSLYCGIAEYMEDVS